MTGLSAEMSDYGFSATLGSAKRKLWPCMYVLPFAGL